MWSATRIDFIDQIDEYVYWIVGASNDSPGEIIRLAGVIRSVESAGQAVS